MIYVGIDVAKHKHDCYIISSDGEILYDVFTIANSQDGFSSLYKAVNDSMARAKDKDIRVGLESTGQYSRNLLEFLLSKCLNPVLLNPLNSDAFRKAQSLRKTKTDKTDARLIASMLMTEDYKPYRKPSYHIITPPTKRWTILRLFWRPAALQSLAILPVLLRFAPCRTPNYLSNFVQCLIGGVITS